METATSRRIEIVSWEADEGSGRAVLVSSESWNGFVLHVAETDDGRFVAVVDYPNGERRLRTFSVATRAEAKLGCFGMVRMRLDRMTCEVSGHIRQLEAAVSKQGGETGTK